MAGCFASAVFRRNGGPGLWFDIDCRDILVTECVFEENEKSGLFIEISREVMAVRNLARGNAIGAVGRAEDNDWSSAGILLGESENCLLAFNTCIGNRDGISIREQGPRPTKTRDGKTIDYHNTGHIIARNELKSNRDHALAFWYDNPFFGAEKSDPANAVQYDPLQQKLTVTGNQYEDAGASAVLWGVPWRERSKVFRDVREFNAATNFESSVLTPDAGWTRAPQDLNAWLNGFIPPWQR